MPAPPSKQKRPVHAAVPAEGDGSAAPVGIMAATVPTKAGPKVTEDARAKTFGLAPHAATTESKEEAETAHATRLEAV